MVLLLRLLCSEARYSHKWFRLGSEAVKNIPNTVVCSSLDAALTALAQPPYADKIERVFVIGGGHIYNEAVKSASCDTIEMTHIDADLPCDTFFPAIDPAVFEQQVVGETHSENNLSYRFVTYARKHNNAKNAVADEMKVPHTNGVHANGTHAKQHEEMQYLDLIRDIIATGVCKQDRTGTGWSSTACT